MTTVNKLFLYVVEIELAHVNKENYLQDVNDDYDFNSSSVKTLTWRS